MDIIEVLRLHNDWLAGVTGGVRANLDGADLYGANLGGANLDGANLRGANLGGADLYGANLRGANLGGANLGGADLYGDNLRGANLSGANLSRASLDGANLSRASLYWANLSRASLYGANLRGANLDWANLSGASMDGADLDGADLSGANLSGASMDGANLVDSNYYLHSIVPEDGSFIGFKKCLNDVIVKLLVIGKRSNSPGSRKCRASKVKVLEVIGHREAVSRHDNKTKYIKGRTIEVKDFDENPANECAPGIHFFLTKKEAEEYQ